MTAKIFGVDIAGIVNKTFDGKLHALTLHKKALAINDYGATSSTQVDHAGEGVRLQWKTDVVTARGYPADAAKILILQNGIAAPTTDDSVTIGEATFRIIDIRTDPVSATWVCAATKEG